VFNLIKKMLEISFLKPEKILQELKLRENMIAVDFGSGSGGWAIPLAKKLEEGKVYAVDIQESALSALKGRASLENILNIETILCDLEKSEGLELIENFFDVVLMTNLLFQLEDKKQVLREAKKILKKEGQLLIVDWKVEVPLGPKEGKISSQELKKIIENLGFKFSKEFEAGDYHYGLVFTKI
jgi:ubiquinone/menaquinone biosynthesis C-methylase UbiE